MGEGKAHCCSPGWCYLHLTSVFALSASPQDRNTISVTVIGQVVDMAKGRLHFSPMFPPPYTMPLLISNCEGSISQAKPNGTITLDIASLCFATITLDIAFVSLKVPAGGLSVGGVSYAKPVDLKAGDSIS